MSRTDLPGISLDPGVARPLALGLAGVRVALGVMAYVAPSLVAAPWVGKKVATKSGGRLLGRALGGRDLALGVGALLAARHDTLLRGWVEAGMLADTGDAVAMLVAWKKLPRPTRWPILGVTLGAAALGAATAPSVDG